MNKLIIVSAMFTVLALNSCSPIKQTSLTSDSRSKNACYQDVKKGLTYILENQKVRDASSYANDANVRSIMRMPSGKIFKISADGWDYNFVLNNRKGKANLTLYEKSMYSLSGKSKTITNTMSKGISSYELTNCNCD